MSDAIRYADALIDQSVDDDLTAALVVPEGCVLVGIYPDAAWDTQTISFQVSWDDLTFGVIYDGAAIYSLAAAVKQKYYALDPTLFMGARQIKIASAVGQGDDTVITCVFYKMG